VGVKDGITVRAQPGEEGRNGKGFLPVTASGGIFQGLQFGFHAGDST